jgi:hypothetical protein
MAECLLLLFFFFFNPLFNDQSEFRHLFYDELNFIFYGQN